MFLQLEKVKAYLKLPTSNTDLDDIVQMWMQSIQQQMETFCHRKFEVGTYTETHTIMHKVFPNQTPIISVQKIDRIGTDVTLVDNAEYEISNYIVYPGYVELPDWQYITMSDKLQYVVQDESKATITYTAGYETIPVDLILAAYKLIDLEYRKWNEERAGVESISEGSVRYTYSRETDEMPADILRVLKHYRKARIA